MSDPLYQEYILELYRQPHNKTVPAEFDVRHKERNPLCSDEVEIFVKFDSAGRVTDIGFQGEGCAISQAGISLITDHAKGKPKEELKQMTTDDMLRLLGLPNISPARLGCATLGLKALQKSINNPTQK
ncbi:MAG: iron-sulfur cluster assembly scaffold protein [Candidatus Magasanikbacteria bacterium]|nr:iron-sulfur cluster assembly scaffold protein [Candidatus Magasanikbacteria bacterium]